jgi:hypothetical protein
MTSNRRTKIVYSFLIPSFSIWHNFIIVLYVRKQTSLFSDKHSFWSTHRKSLCFLIVFTTKNKLISLIIIYLHDLQLELLTIIIR